MNFKSLADMAKNAIAQRGGTERLKQDAARLKDIATGPGTPQEKAKRASEALKQPQADIAGQASSPSAGSPMSGSAGTPVGDTAGIPVRPLDETPGPDGPLGGTSPRP